MKTTAIATLLLVIIIFSGCGSSVRFTGNETRTKKENKRPDTADGRDTGKKKETEKVKEYSDYSSLQSKTGVASFYSSEFNGRQTASGETYRMNDLTAAHREFPFNTILKVTNLDNNKSVIVRINDRGPVKTEREIDLSLGAAKIIGLDNSGTCKVQLDVIKWGE